ncbi:HAD family hydrolase [Clostridium niameyense]|uniref:HAD family hydrolase n=1 Tax=Clostridium niameyense TaxID=1622073 RepID=A0A6M0R8V7_9CLOT|nr:HAD-IA family hydrolase [Clostridium niameyense]NEZ46685.1 HAD family hydrolase [Clostridium niameyense]
MLKSIIFDMDGVIIDTEPLSYKASKILVGNYNKEYTYGFHKTCMGRSMFEVMKMTKDHYNLPGEVYELLEERNKVYSKIAMEESKPIDGIFQLLDYIKVHNIDCAVVTGSDKKIAEAMLNKLGIIEYFKFILSGDEMEKSKPDPWPYNEAMKRLRSNSSESIILEDSINGIKAALAAGCRVIAVNSIWEDKSEKGIISFEKDLGAVHKIIEDLII